MRKQRTTRITFVLVACMLMQCAAVFLFEGIASADTTTAKVSGYSLEISWKVNKKNRRFITWGKIYNGRACNNLGLYFTFYNEKVKREMSLDPVIENYSPSSEGREFYKKIKAITKKSQHDWELVDIQLQCR